MNKPSTVFERHQSILDLLKERTSISVTELSETLDVSEGTIRNDLQALDEQGQLRRVRGGAVAPKHLIAHGTSLHAQAQVNAEQKQWIAKWASGQIDSGDVILLDSSTTVLHIAQYLVDRTNLTIVTNGVEVGRILSANPTNRVILIGSVLQPDGNSLIGTANNVLLQTLNIQTGFFSCVGFSTEFGLLESDLQIAELKKQILSACRKRIALFDSSKVGKGALTPFITLDDVDHIVTDTNMNNATIEAIRKSGTNVTVCDESTVTTHSSYETNGIYRIGFANISEELPFGRDVRRGLELALQRTNNIELIVADNQLNPEIALTVADNLIDQNIDLFIEYQIDENVGNLIASKFNAANIPIISIDIPMVGATFFGVNNYDVGLVAGRALGKAVLEEWQGEFDFLIALEHPRAGNLPAMRIKGQLDGFQQILDIVPSNRIIRLDSGNTTQVSERVVMSMMQQVGTQKRFAVICFNDDASIGALQAAQQLDAEDSILIVGQGGDRLMRIELRKPNTRIVGSTAFRPEAYGEKLAALAQRILHGESVPPAVYVDQLFINPDNVDQYYPGDIRS
ncbi:MAG: DeoR family transcriptional regulator [Aggregatilineales bacterium]